MTFQQNQNLIKFHILQTLKTDLYLNKSLYTRRAYLVSNCVI